MATSGVKTVIPNSSKSFDGFLLLMHHRWQGTYRSPLALYIGLVSKRDIDGTLLDLSSDTSFLFH